MTVDDEVTARMLGRHHRSVHPPEREAPMATPNIETISVIA